MSHVVSHVWLRSARCRQDHRDRLTDNQSSPSRSPVLAQRATADQYGRVHIRRQKRDHCSEIARPALGRALGSTGAEVVVNRLLAEGVDVCFANPGTSEMHFVAALDAAPRCARCCVCSRASLPEPPTGTHASPVGPLRHCCTWAPVWRNGLANLHNARRAFSPWSMWSATTRPITKLLTPPGI